MPQDSGTFSAFKHRDFRYFWGGQLISLVGTWMQSVGQSWLVLELTHSPFKLGLISTLQFTPMLLFSLFSGVWVDRLPKRKLIIATQSILMLCAFVLFALTARGIVTYWHICILALVLGTAQSLDMPARQSFIVEMVGRDDLMNAIALNSAMFNGARIVGPAVAGLVVARTGSAWAFLINGISFIAVIIALLAIRTESKRKEDRGDVLTEVAEGLKYAKSTPIVLTCLITMALVSVFSINPQVLLPLLAKNVLHRGAEGFGFLMSASGVGALLGALFLANLSGKRGGDARSVTARMRLIFTGASALGISLISASVLPYFAAAVPLVFITGFSQIVFSASINTNLQSVVPDNLRGRVMGLYALVFTGVTPLGSLLMGTSSASLGVRPTFALAGGLGLASAISMAAIWNNKKKGQSITQ